MMRSTLLWLMSRSCQRATFSRAATALPRSTRARPVSRSQVMGLRLCGMALLPFWPLVNGSSASSTSVRCRWRNSTAQRSMLAPTSASVVMKFGVDVALDNLRGDGRGAQAEFFADESLDARREMRAGADRAGEFADGGDFAGAFEAFERAAKFVVHQRELEAERRRLGVDAVAAADAGREFDILRACWAMDGQQRLHVGNEDVRALHHLHGERGVNDVAAGEAEMEPAAGVVVDFFGDGGGEADDVVVERLFQFLLARDEAGQVGKPLVRAGFDFGEIGARHDAFLDQGLAGEQFDLQPEAELVFVRSRWPAFPGGNSA